MISIWRYHCNELDVVAMNESNIDSCSLSYNRFVHDIIFIIFQMLLVIYFLILIIVYTVHFFQMSLKSMSVIYFLMMMKMKVIFFRF